MARMRSSYGLGIALAGLATVVLGCNVSMDDGNGGGDGSATEDTVLVVFRNLSLTSAVEVNFHATDAAVHDLPADLFQEPNRITRDVGIAGTGIIQPGQVDLLRQFPCSDDLIVGTSGGRFLNNETGELVGEGQPRWVEAGSAGLCGGAVTFTYRDDGGFLTELSIVH